MYKYDLRFTQPNKEFMKMDALHSIEHLMAENIRNHTDQVVDLSPMGCQTGFYLSVINHDDYDEILVILEKTLQDVSWQQKCQRAMKCNVDGLQTIV